MPVLSGIYAIHNIVSNTFYIGKASNLTSRKTSHFNNLKKQKHENNHLQNSYDKYGAEAFTFTILELIRNKERLPERERIWIQYFRELGHQLYNMMEADNNQFHHSEETKEKLRKKAAQREPQYNIYESPFVWDEKRKGMVLSEEHLRRIGYIK